ncbi:MAG: DUF11 domain-containing protein [Planctomycetes bacterium]|nr:DUF11 domain-containing protein [Planctomycetota bacterium]
MPARKPRSFFLRFTAPVGLALAVVAGGGWGVYHFLGNSSDTNDSFAETEKSQSDREEAHSATDQLKNLFASTAGKEASSLAKETATDAKAGRYSLTATTSTQPFSAAPELPPTVAENTNATAEPPAVAKISEMVARSTPSPLGSRYATAPRATAIQDEPVSPPAPEETPQKEATFVAASDDVTRGQEPESNPLRASGQTSEQVAGDFDARAAFAQAPGVAPPSTSEPTLASPPKNFASSDNGRYQAAEPTLAEPPSADFSANEPSRRPAPAFGIESAPPIPAPRQAAPLAATQIPMATPLAAAAVVPPVAQADLGPTDITPTPGITTQPGTGRPGEQLLEGMQSASISIQKLVPPEIQVGRRCTFAIRVRNTGQRTAQNVQIRDEIPLGTELVGTAPQATVSGSQLVWDLGSLSVGEERLVEMELLPTEEREIGSVATVTLAAQASAKALCTRPQLALRLTTKPQVLAGKQHLVQIELSNPGSGDATGVMLLETIPAGVSHEAGPALEFEIGTLQAGETRRMELILTAEQAGKITNVMTARADANLRVEAKCEFEVLAPELKVSVEGPKRRYLERPATYRVSINNPGTATARDIQLTTKLSKGLQFVGADNMGEYDSATHTVQWSLAELPANERGVVELTALPIEAGEQILQVSTSASQGLEDRTDKRVQVEGITALTFEVSDSEGLIEVGGKTTYEIVVANQGSKTATNVQIVAIMPPGLRALSGQGDSQHTVQDDRIIFSPLPQLAPKGEATFRIQAQGTRPGDQRVRVMIQSDDLQQPITKEVNTRVYADE